jgi:hypothetical protein
MGYFWRMIITKSYNFKKKTYNLKKSLITREELLQWVPLWLIFKVVLIAIKGNESAIVIKSIMETEEVGKETTLNEFLFDSLLRLSL